MFEAKHCRSSKEGITTYLGSSETPQEQWSNPTPVKTDKRIQLIHLGC